MLQAIPTSYNSDNGYQKPKEFLREYANRCKLNIFPRICSQY